MFIIIFRNTTALNQSVAQKKLYTIHYLMIIFIQEESCDSRCKLQADVGKPVPNRDAI